MKEKIPEPIIFVISGKARAGKDTTASYIIEYAKKRNLKAFNLQYSFPLKNYAMNISDWDGNEETKPRKLLQDLGTLVIREKIDDLFFVKRMISDIMIYSYYFDVITISDARYPVEIDKIKQRFPNVKSVIIKRPGFKSNLTKKQQNHVSERALDNYDKFDYEVVNDGSLDDLRKKVNNMVKEVL